MQHTYDDEDGDMEEGNGTLSYVGHGQSMGKGSKHAPGGLGGGAKENPWGANRRS